MVGTGRADRNHGFTLVELLVSLAVLALIALTMTAALRFVVRAVGSTDQRREALEELTLGLSLLRGELQRAEPLMRRVGQQTYVMFEGTPERVRFVNVEPPYLAGSPYTAYEFSVTPDAGAWRVDVRRAALDPSEPDLAVVAAADPRTVLRLTQAVKFSYWGSRRPREAPSWHEEWPAGTLLPHAVRLAASENPGWPELVAQLRVTAPWYCAAGDSGTGSGGAGSRAGCPGEDGTGTGNASAEPSSDKSLLDSEGRSFGSTRGERSR
ncbi:MAG: prepilin-type N-terminal cleavage/methylation domain-containing protein [Geminicoccaceae bacterium]